MPTKAKPINLAKLLDKHDACTPKVDLYGSMTPKKAWEAAGVSDRCWIIGRIMPLADCQWLALEMAETVIDLMPQASRDALVVVRGFLEGKKTQREINAAYAAAYAAYASAAANAASANASAANAYAANAAANAASAREKIEAIQMAIIDKRFPLRRLIAQVRKTG